MKKFIFIWSLIGLMFSIASIVIYMILDRNDALIVGLFGIVVHLCVIIEYK